MSREEYELSYAIGHLVSRANKLGINDSTVLEGNEGNMMYANKNIIELAVDVYKVWAALYPHEHKSFISNAEFELDTERSVKESIKQGGIFSVSYPTRVNELLHVLMPNVKTQDKRFYKPLLTKIPELKRSNYV